jgi:hypothetical protein
MYGVAYTVHTCIILPRLTSLPRYLVTYLTLPCCREEAVDQIRSTGIRLPHAVPLAFDRRLLAADGR